MVQLFGCIIKAKPKICMFRQTCIRRKKILSKGKINTNLRRTVISGEWVGERRGRELHTGTFRLLVVFQYLGGMVLLFHFIIE